MKKHYYLLGCGILSIIGLLNYWRVLAKPHVYETLDYVIYPLTFGKYSSFWGWLFEDFITRQRFIRPVPFFIQGGLFEIGLGSTVVFHLINLVVLVFIAILIFRFLLKEKLVYGAALAGGLIVIVHPLSVMMASDTICLGVLLGCLFLVIALNNYQKFRDARKTLLDYGIESVIVALMFFSYEQLIVAPLILIGYELYKSNWRWSKIRFNRLIPSAAIWFALLGLYLLLRLILFHDIGGYGLIENQKLYMTIGVFIKYLTGIYYAGCWGISIKFMMLLLIPFLLIVPAFRWKALPGLLFGLIWMVASMLPFISAPSSGEQVFFLPLLGLAVSVGFWINHLKIMGGDLSFKWISITSTILIALFWIAGNQTSIGYRISELLEEYNPSRTIYNQAVQIEGDLTVVYAAERFNRHIPLRLESMLEKEMIRFLYIPLGAYEEHFWCEIEREISDEKTGQVLFVKFLRGDFEFFDSLIELKDAVYKPS